MIYDSILDVIGQTPLIRISRYAKRMGLTATLLAKPESMNPGGSAKDRVALQLIRHAEAEGQLQPGGAIIEATSGNTGVGLAMVARVLGYRVILTMPDSMSIERRNLLKAFGAELVLTEGNKGMAGANEAAARIHAETPNSIRAMQFENPANPEAHMLSTGPEICRATDGRIDAFVATAGTGGTVSGTGRYLKAQNPNIRVYAVEPTESPMLSKGVSGSHGIQGIGANFVPKTFDRSVIDGILTVSTEEATETARLLVDTEGMLCGISSGACLCAATQLAKQPAFSAATIVVLLPDTGERYLSMGLFG